MTLAHSPKIDRIAGYFTQLVWKETKNLEEIECWTAYFGTYCAFTCNYYPAGNSIGLYGINVFPNKAPIDGEVLLDWFFIYFSHSCFDIFLY